MDETTDTSTPPSNDLGSIFSGGLHDYFQLLQAKTLASSYSHGDRNQSYTVGPDGQNVHQPSQTTTGGTSAGASNGLMIAGVALVGVVVLVLVLRRGR